jgi:hypothetical protein
VAHDLMTRPQVVRAAGDEASGLASMIADLLEQNIGDFPLRARVVALTRGDVVLTASDQDLSVTLQFGGDRVIVRDGAVPGAPALAGTWLEMARVCSGQVSALAAVRARTIRVTPGHNPIALAGAGFALSVPPSFYEGDSARRARRRRATLITLALTVGVLALLVARRRSVHRRTGGR